MWYSCYNPEGKLITEIELHDMEIPPEIVVMTGIEYWWNEETRSYEEFPF